MNFIDFGLLKNFSFGLILLLALLSSSNPQAQEIFLTRIKSDYSDKSYSLYLRLNEHRLISHILTKHDQKNKTKSYPVNVLTKPIVLAKAVGVTLVSLVCTHFATNRGCDIEIEYPSNITVGEYKTFTAKLTKKDQKWQLIKDEKPFTELNLKARKLLGLLIGIKSISIQ